MLTFQLFAAFCLVYFTGYVEEKGVFETEISCTKCSKISTYNYTFHCCVGKLVLCVDEDFSLLVNDKGITAIY
jgi:hypothetical protein